MGIYKISFSYFGLARYTRSIEEDAADWFLSDHMQPDEMLSPVKQRRHLEVNIPRSGNFHPTVKYLAQRAW